MATNENIENEEYLELYKKYRPSAWKDLLGQERVAKTLQTAVVRNRIPTVFLFSGPRGCGKTSAAFLMAKAINCPNVDKNGNPCNQCEICLGIDANSIEGFEYISAAQYSGVDDMRELVGRAQLSSPMKKKVFIIDEIHNLKQGKGFEALLIPVETKGMPALFIFCTTEISKIPDTILSRLQKRRFKLVKEDVLLPHLEEINTAEHLEATEDMMMQAIRLGRGSVRDTLSEFESIVATGTSLENYGGKILEALAAKNVGEMFKTTSSASENGEDLQEMAEKLFEDLRTLYLLASGVSYSELTDVPVNNVAEVVKNLEGRMGIYSLLKTVGECIKQAPFGLDSRLLLEVTLVKAIDDLKRIEKAKKARS